MNTLITFNCRPRIAGAQSPKPPSRPLPRPHIISLNLLRLLLVRHVRRWCEIPSSRQRAFSLFVGPRYLLGKTRVRQHRQHDHVIDDRDQTDPQRRRQRPDLKAASDRQRQVEEQVEDGVLDSPLLAAPVAWFFWTRLA